MAPAVPLVDALCVRCAFHLGSELELQAHDVRGSLDTCQRPRGRGHLWQGTPSPTESSFLDPIAYHIQAAAYKLGADYPAELYENSFAKLSMTLYLLLAHGLRLKKSRTSHD